MDQQTEVTWVREALKLVEDAKRAGAKILFVRRQDVNGEADIVVTNVVDEQIPGVVAALKASEAGSE